MLSSAAETGKRTKLKSLNLTQSNPSNKMINWNWASPLRRRKLRILLMNKVIGLKIQASKLSKLIVLTTSIGKLV
jgi:hypothetical protein